MSTKHPRKLTYLVVGFLALEGISALLFVGSIFGSVLGFAPVGWQIHEFLEIGAAIGLVLGIVLGAIFLRRILKQNLHLTDQVKAASGAFGELLEERFVQWGLTPAERDVALFSIKGMSVGEIATLRSTSEGTVKAKTNAIYRKSGVAGRAQLLSQFIEDLMQEGGIGAPDEHGPG